MKNFSSNFKLTLTLVFTCTKNQTYITISLKSIVRFGIKIMKEIFKINVNFNKNKIFNVKFI